MAVGRAKKKTNGKRHATQQSVNSAIKSICDVMRRSNCAGAMKYVPELTWILFLRILDEREVSEVDEAEALGLPFVPSLVAPYRWSDWAAPESPRRQDTRPEASVWKFVHDELSLNTVDDTHVLRSYGRTCCANLAKRPPKPRPLKMPSTI